MAATFFGHPRGLATLFLTEMWERFTFYGMRAVLLLFLVAAVSTGGFGLDDRTGAAIYGLCLLYTSNKPSYAELIESGSIDVAISPQTVTIGSLLAHVRRGDVVRVHSLRRGAAEALEVVVHGDADSSKVIGRRIEDIALPEGTTLGAVVRGEDVIIAHHDTTVQPDDHLILFLTDRRHIEAVEKLFQGSASFL